MGYRVPRVIARPCGLLSDRCMSQGHKMRTKTNKLRPMTRDSKNKFRTFFFFTIFAQRQKKKKNVKEKSQKNPILFLTPLKYEYYCVAELNKAMQTQNQAFLVLIVPGSIQVHKYRMKYQKKKEEQFMNNGASICDRRGCV